MAFGYRMLFISYQIHVDLVKLAYHYIVSLVLRENRVSLQEIINDSRYYCLAFITKNKENIQVLYIIAFIGICATLFNL